MQKLYRSVLVVCLWCTCLFSHAQVGLTARPINLTCVAPESSQARISADVAVLSGPTRNLATAGRDSGIVYRGRDVSALQGHYVYLQDGKLFVEFDSEHGVAVEEVELNNVNPVSLVEGVDSEIYILDQRDTAFKLNQSDTRPLDAPANLLSQTGCFDSVDPKIPAQGLIPYQPAAPLWSDSAVKRRWIAMPDWHAADTQISVLADGDFDFPNGTVLIKEFRLGSTLAETRLFVKALNGDWAGYSYEWNDAQTDATLLIGRKTKQINGQEWLFPGPFECTFCHSAAANRSLGLEVAQLNNEYLYLDTDILANQLETLDGIGLIAGGLGGPTAQLDSFANYDDQSVAVDLRARAYLHSNCSNCHRPGGMGQGPEDFRYQLDGNQIGANDVTPWLGDLGVTGAKLLVRGNADLSIVSLRMKHLSFYRMPPLGTSLIDPQGVALIDDWINSGLGFGIGDDDEDQKANDLDNCLLTANPSQLDTDADGFGNLCDADLNNDNIVNFLDLALFSSVFLSADADADFNGDGIVNFIDLPILANSFFSAPGPSGTQP